MYLGNPQKKVFFMAVSLKKKEHFKTFFPMAIMSSGGGVDKALMARPLK